MKVDWQREGLQHEGFDPRGWAPSVAHWPVTVHPHDGLTIPRVPPWRGCIGSSALIGHTVGAFFWGARFTRKEQ
jgi:hypothetical protein